MSFTSPQDSDDDDEDLDQQPEEEQTSWVVQLKRGKWKWDEWCFLLQRQSSVWALVEVHSTAEVEIIQSY